MKNKKNKASGTFEFSKEFLSQFGDPASLRKYMQDLRRAVMEEMLEGELDDHLGYPPYARSTSANYRNGKTTKTVHSSDGTFELNVPRDRDGNFDPVLVKKGQKTLEEIEDKVISLYGLGMSTADI